MSVLHITNGGAIVPNMQAAGIRGRIVPWDDVLHEGPVPAGLNAAALRDVRAEFLATWVGESRDAVERSLRARDEALDDLGGVDEIVLWFEHDLYDQLQLIQVLDRIGHDRAPRVSAVPDDDYLGHQPAEQFAALFSGRRAITSAQVVAARDAWNAFRADDPRRIVEVLDRLADLPHLAPALRRHLEQFPSRANGLSRTEQQTLEAAARGVSRVRDLFLAAHHDREEAIFMGDLAFVFHISRLVPRLLSLDDDVRVTLGAHVSITEDGRRVLAGDADAVTLCGIDRWLGGVHLHGHGPVWRRDVEQTSGHLTLR